ncbi:MAG: hypothetical protein MJ252_23780 [archaeon]|nr:hypothetical protein [archaeon]
MTDAIYLKYYIIGHTQVGKKDFVKKINTFNPAEKPKDKNKTIESSDTKEDIANSSDLIEFKVKGKSIFCQFFILNKAEHLLFDEKIPPEDPDYEICNKHKIKFTSMKSSLISALNYKPKRKFPEKIEIINNFILMYDLSNFDSFRAVELYNQSLNAFYEEINPGAIYLIGNKMEIKEVLNKEDRKILSEFLTENKEIKNYEISNRIFFDFQTFLTKILHEHLSSLNIEYNDLYNALKVKQSFSKSPRITTEDTSCSPGPIYDTNVYGLGSPEEYRQALVDKKGRFNRKIFLNKRGPVIRKEVEVISKANHETPEEEAERLKMSQKLKDNFQKAAKYLMECKPTVGYSFGNSPSNFNLIEKRRKKRDKSSDELKSSFDSESNNLSHIFDSPPKKEKDHSYFESIDQRRENYQNSISNKRAGKRQVLKELQQKSYKNMQDELIKKQNEAPLINVCQSYSIDEKINSAKERYLNIIFGKNKDHIKSFNDCRNNKSTEEEVCPPLYNISQDLLNPSKGISITGKRREINHSANNAPYRVMKTDFDRITDVQKNYSNCYVPRYHKESSKEKDDVSEILKKNYLEQQAEKEEKFNNNRLSSQRNKNIMRFLSEENERNKISKEFNRKLKEREEKLKNSLAKELNPNYKAIEPNVKSYSFGYGQREIKTKNPMDPSIVYPKMDFVRPSNSGYHFEKSPRFNVDKPKKESVLFQNQKYALDDQTSFLKGEIL